MTFSELGLNDQLLTAIEKANYKDPYPIQIEAIPAFLKHQDILGIAPTGSGKTASYILPILQLLQSKKENRSRNVPVLVPTKDSISIRNELSLSLLVEKLIAELKRLKRDNPNIRLGLDEEVLLIFFSEFVEGVSVQKQTDEFTGLTALIVTDPKQRPSAGKDLRPMVKLIDAKGKDLCIAGTDIPASYYLPAAVCGTCTGRLRPRCGR